MPTFNNFNPFDANIWIRRAGTVNDPFVQINESVQVNNNRATLKEIPDKLTKVTVTGNNTTWNEIKTGAPTPSEYIVDYQNGYVTFDSSLNGLTLTFAYKGTGQSLLPDNRLFLTSVYNSTGVVQTLNDLTNAANTATNNANSIKHLGTYSSSTSYVVNNMVNYQGATYMCISNTTNNVPTNTTYWRKITSFKNQGVYSTTTTYYYGDFVSDSSNQNSYMCIADSALGVPLTDTTAWQLVISVASTVSSLNSAESSRVTSENTRQNNESTRQSNETNRTTAESSRVTAENSRATAESTRSTNETTRQNNESTRQSNETSRQTSMNNFVHLGVWNSTTAYQVRNVVTYNGSSYMCILANTNQLPTNTTYWQLAAQAGSITQVSSANADISVTNGTTAPTLTLNSGTGANQMLKLDNNGKASATLIADDATHRFVTDTDKTNWNNAIPNATNSVTDTNIGNRTADPTQVPAASTGTITQFLSWFSNRIKAITGTTNWYDAPPTTLTTANSHIGNTSNPHSTTAAQVGAVASSSLATASTAGSTAQRAGDGSLTAKQFISDIATGTAPMVVSSTTKNANFNADMTDGYHVDTGITANTIPIRDANGNIPVNVLVSGQNPNLLFNPSFRLGYAGWRGIGSNGFSVAFGNSGEGGYLQTPTSTTTSGAQVDNNLNMIPAAANLQYTLSGEMFTGGITAGSISLQWFAFDSNKTAVSGGTVSATNGQGWKNYSTSFTTPANTAFIQVACLINSNTTISSGVAGWRKIKLEGGSISTTFSDDNTVNTLQYGGISGGLAQVLSGGYKIQSANSSGVVATAGTAVNVTVNFPVAFSVAPDITIGITTVSVGDAGYINVRASNITATNATFTINSYVAQTIGFNWKATGS